MELEQRVAALEKQIQDLRMEIQTILLEIRDSLPENSHRLHIWEKKAWIWALLNIVLAIALFSNLPYSSPSFLPLPWRDWFEEWIHPFWISLAFVWLLLQMYPLALSLSHEKREWRDAAERNLIGFLRTQPYLILLLTAVVLIVALIKDIFPPAAILIGLALVVALISQGLSYCTNFWRGQPRS